MQDHDEKKKKNDYPVPQGLSGGGVQQAAFDFYALAPGTSITEIADPVRLKKNNAAIYVQNSSFNLVTRRMINACMYIARPNILTKDRHEVDLDYFLFLCNFNSRNVRHLREEFRKILTTPIEAAILDAGNPERDLWHGTPLLYDITLGRGKISFRVPESLRNSIHHPETYTYLSLRTLANFSSQYAHVLYEIASSMHYRGDTGWWTVEEFRNLMGATGDVHREFKFLKQKVINPAMKQINEDSDLLLTLDLRKDGRTITHVRFLIEMKPERKNQEALQLSESLYKMLYETFGLSDDTIRALTEEYPADYIHEKADFTVARSRGGKIENISGFFLQALKDNYRAPAEVKKEIEHRKQSEDVLRNVKERESRRAKSDAAMRQMCLGRFDALSEIERNALLAEFEDGLAKPFRKYLKEQGLEHKLVNAEWETFLARKFGPESE
jgi:hypothetical protein